MDEIALTKFLSLSERKQKIVLEYMGKLLKEEAPNMDKLLKDDWPAFVTIPPEVREHFKTLYDPAAPVSDNVAVHAAASKVWNYMRKAGDVPEDVRAAFISLCKRLNIAYIIEK